MINFTSRLFLAMTLLMGSAWAQEYPNKPIRIVVPYSPGGGTDAVARLMGDKLSAALKQPVIVENKAGASANIGTEFVARAPADGYTILVTAPNFTTSEALFDNPGWKFEDFVPVIQLTRYSNVLVASPDSPFSTIQEVLDAAKAGGSSGPPNFGSAGAGSNAHLSIELLNLRTDAALQHVAYKGSGPLKTDLLGGHIPLGADGLAGMSDLIKTGKLKALAVLSPERSKLAPEIPSLGDIGIDDVDGNGWSGALVPAGTPAEVVARLQSAFADALKDPEMAARLEGLGLEPVGGSSDDFRSYLMGERTKWADLIKAKNIKFE